MSLLSIEDLDDDFYLRLKKNFILKFLASLEKDNNLSKVISTPSSNIRRIKITGIIKCVHFKKLLELKPVRNHLISKNLQSIKVGDRGIEVPLKLPLINSQKIAALIGHVMGDGTITNYGSFEYTNKDYALIEKVRNYIKDSFDCDTYRERHDKRKNGILFKIIYPAAVGRLLKKFGAPQGKKVTQIFDVPDWIKESDLKTKSEFLKALFDDDGSVEVSGMLSFTNSKRKNLRKHHEIYIDSICRLLQEFDITTQKRFRDRKDGNFKSDIRVTNLRNLEKFDKLIGFTQRKRNSRLKEILLNPSRKYDKLGEGKKILFEILKNSNKAQTTEELSNSINRNLSMTRLYLFRLEKDGIIERVFPQRHKVKTLWKCKGKKCEVPQIDSLYSIINLLSTGPKSTAFLSKELNRDMTTIRRNIRKLETKKIVKIERYEKNAIWWELSREYQVPVQAQL